MAKILIHRVKNLKPVRIIKDNLVYSFILLLLLLIGFLVTFFWFTSGKVRPDLPALPIFTSNDKIMIFAPHPDDEGLGTSGVIEKALEAKSQVKVVYLTYGESNELATAIFRKRLWSGSSSKISVGEQRRGEAISAMGKLGLKESDLTFLGYPDQGTMDIWDSHWDGEPAYKSKTTASDKVPYSDSVSAGKAYTGDNILADFESQIKNFQPTYVFTTSPIDSHSDHQATYLYAQAAISELKVSITKPKVYTCPIHFGSWTRPDGFRPNSWLAVPKKSQIESWSWSMLILDQNEIEKKAEAIRSYRTQYADHGWWMMSFAKQNELFSAPADINLSGTTEFSGQSNATVAEPQQNIFIPARSGNVKGVSYAENAGNFQIKISLNYPLEKDLGLSVYAFGESSKTIFPEMPKINLKWVMGKLYVYDQSSLLSSDQINVSQSKKEIVFSIPLSTLGNPDQIFSHVEGTISEAPIYQTTWETINL